MSAYRLFVATAAFLLPASHADAATILTFASDADWIAATASGQPLAFTKLGGATVRAGNRGTSGDWEIGIVNAVDAPIVQGQQAWAATNGLTPNGMLGFASYTAGGIAAVAYSLGGSDRSLSGAIGTGANSIWIRARTNPADSSTAAALYGLTLELGSTSIALGDLLGDGNANYIGVIDSRLAAGFRLGFANAAFDPRTSNGSNVLLQVKIGNSPLPVVPEPATWALMIAGFGLVGSALRRRRAGGHATA